MLYCLIYSDICRDDLGILLFYSLIISILINKNTVKPVFKGTSISHKMSLCDRCPLITG